MTCNDQNRVNRAIRDCLEFCYQSQHIIPKMAEFLSTLKATDGWREAEVHEVEVAVRRVLCNVVDGATCAGNAASDPESDAERSDSKAPKVNGI